ncbi:hypothetical protein SAMD00019534_005660, partial [Acytostelium subglobosum LB1]|uniref:hypothetical protein n=1 Tax=Acytostelium subglobosum LB1 TaxID=1410327 RepID=UPI000644B90A
GVWPSVGYLHLSCVNSQWHRLALSSVTKLKVENLWLTDRNSDASKWINSVNGWFGRYHGEHQRCFLESITLRIGLMRTNVPSIMDNIVDYCRFISLNLSCNFLGTEGARVIIQRLVMDEGRNTLASLNLSNNKIEDGAIVDLANALITNTSLHTLNLSMNYFSTRGITALFDTLAQHNQSLTDLNIEGMPINEAAASIANALRSNVASLSRPDCALTTLEINNNNLEDEGLFELCKLFRHNSSLTRLSMRSNNLTFCGVSHLCHALSFSNVQLRELDLSNNPLSSNAALYLGYLFDHCPNKTLQICRLRFCQIDGNGCQVISQALRSNTSLTYLDLNGNNIKPEGCRELATLISANQTLKTLKLGNNSIGNQGATYLAASLKDNKTLTSLDLENNDITICGAHQIIEALKVNDTLHDINLWVCNVPRNLRLFLKKS